LGDELRKLGVASTELLKNRLEHAGLLLDDLTKLLELGIVSQEIQVAKITVSLTTSCGGSRGRYSTGAGTGTRASTGASLSLSGKIEQVDCVALITASLGGHSAGNRGRSGVGVRCGSSLALRLGSRLLTGGLRDSLFHQQSVTNDIR